MKGNWDAGRDPLVALRRGDPLLFEEFVRTEIGTFLRFFRRLGAARQEAEDLTQEVLLKLYTSAPTYEPRARFASYTLRVARNAWIDRRRRRAVREGEPSLDEASGDSGGTWDGPLLERLAARGSDAVAELSEAEDRRRLSEAIEALPPLHAAVFELAVIQGLPYADIASALEIPEGTVKSRVFHALRKLRAALENEGDA